MPQPTLPTRPPRGPESNQGNWKPWATCARAPPTSGIPLCPPRLQALMMVPSASQIHGNYSAARNLGWRTGAGSSGGRPLVSRPHSHLMWPHLDCVPLPPMSRPWRTLSRPRSSTKMISQSANGTKPGLRLLGRHRRGVGHTQTRAADFASSSSGN
jgi:hypothetical protein